MEYEAMSEWMDMDQWQRCADMARPGIVFEIRNADSQSMLTSCTALLPTAPFDWKSAPVRFRAVAEPRPEHSAPLPKPNPSAE
jgi:hypothetical protein